MNGNSLLVYLSVWPPMYRRTTNLFALACVHFCKNILCSLIHSQHTYLKLQISKYTLSLRKMKILFFLRITNGIFSLQLDPELARTRTQVPGDPLSSKMVDRLKKVNENPMNIIKEVYQWNLIFHTLIYWLALSRYTVKNTVHWYLNQFSTDIKIVLFFNFYNRIQLVYLKKS